VGHEVIVAHARNVRLIGESREKDDRLDARTLARPVRIDPIPGLPWRVRPRLQHYPAARHLAEDFLHGLRRGRHFLFQNHFFRFIQNAVPTPSVSQIQPDRQFLTCIFFGSGLF
jgi:hypothetical protein